METIGEDGSFRPAAGTLTVYEVPSGQGVRTDGFGYSGYQYQPFLRLAAGQSHRPLVFPQLCRRHREDHTGAERIPHRGCRYQHSVPAEHPGTRGFRHRETSHTRFVDEQITALVAASVPRRRFVEPIGGAPVAGGDAAQGGNGAGGGYAGARVDDAWDPLALFKHDTEVKSKDGEEEGIAAPVEITMPAGGTIVTLDVAVDDEVAVGRQLAVIETMGFRHVLKADRSGIVQAVLVSIGDTAQKGDPIIMLMEGDVEPKAAQEVQEIQEAEGADPDLHPRRPGGTERAPFLHLRLLSAGKSGADGTPRGSARRVRISTSCSTRGPSRSSAPW